MRRFFFRNAVRAFDRYSSFGRLWRRRKNRCRRVSTFKRHLVSATIEGWFCGVCLWIAGWRSGDSSCSLNIFQIQKEKGFVRTSNKTFFFFFQDKEYRVDKRLNLTYFSKRLWHFYRWRKDEQSIFSRSRFPIQNKFRFYKRTRLIK